LFLKTSTIATFPNSNNKSSKERKSIPFAHKYRTAHFLGPSIKIGEVKLALLIQTCFLCEMICFRFLKISMLTVVYSGTFSVHVLFTLFVLLAHSGVQHILCCVFVWFSSFCEHYVISFPGLPFLDCPIGIL
jgi:hypothetical protein